MISLIITNYKTWDLTERCIKSVDAVDVDKIITEIIVVDDCSAEPVPHYIQQHQLVKIIVNAANQGYAKSVNIGFKHSTNDICLLLDSDAYLISNPKHIFSNFDKNSYLGLLGFKLVDEQGNKTGNGDVEANAWNLILGQQLDSLFKKIFLRKVPIESLYSCAIAVRRTAFFEAGGFDESFDFLDADHDFSMKINRSKWAMNVDNEIIIFHKGGGSPQLTSKRVVRYYTNRLKLLRKHHLLPNENLVKSLILARLYTELFTLSTIGRIKYAKNILSDKIYSRKQLITNLKSL